MPTDTFVAPGANNWTCPARVFSITVEGWGGGGKGGNGDTSANDYGGWGGGGGAYALKYNVAVVPGVVYVATVGGQAALSKFTVGGVDVCIAASGVTATNDSSGGAGGPVSSCVGDIKYKGGDGAVGVWPNTGGGGGGGAGSGGAGGNAGGAQNKTGGTGTANGGGAGGTGVLGGDSDGAPGSAYGGGGAGANAEQDFGHVGGVGAAGAVALSYVPLPYDTPNLGDIGVA